MIAAALAIATPLLAMFSESQGQEGLWELLQRAWLIGTPYFALNSRDYSEHEIAVLLRAYVAESKGAEEYAHRVLFADFFLLRMNGDEEPAAWISFSTRELRPVWLAGVQHHLEDIKNSDIDVLEWDTMALLIEKETGVDIHLASFTPSIASYDDEHIFFRVTAPFTAGVYHLSQILKTKRPDAKVMGYMRNVLKLAAGIR